MSSDRPTNAELLQIVADCMAGKRPISDLAKYGLTIDPLVTENLDKLEVFEQRDDEAPPNLRLKLSGRGGRLTGNGLVLIATAAPRSLSAIR
jgi:hypothetical protein